MTHILPVEHGMKETVAPRGKSKENVCDSILKSIIGAREMTRLATCH